MKKNILNSRDSDGKLLPFSEIKKQCLYIDQEWTVKEDTSTIIRNVISVYKDYLGNFVNFSRVINYPLYLGAAEAVFYLPNFMKMRVIMNPASFNQPLAGAITSNVDHYMGNSKLIGNKVPKVSSLYRGAFTTAIPYTITNWGSRLLVFKSLWFQEENALKQWLVYYYAAFVGGFLGAFWTVPLFKMHMSNHYLHSKQVANYDYKTIYDSVFIETKYAKPKKTLFQKLRIWYRYSGPIALRGGIQGAATLGTFASFRSRISARGINTESEDVLSDYITSENPVISKLKSTGFLKNILVDQADEYRIGLVATLYSSVFGSIIMTGVDFYFLQALKQGLVKKDKKLNLRQKMAKIRTKQVGVKSIAFLFTSNLMRFVPIIWAISLIEEFN